MKGIRNLLIILGMALVLATPAAGDLRISVGAPHLDVRLNLPVFPELLLIPGLPVYFAPRVEGNYFFYDGLYWIYIDDYWYASDWYDGPWWLVEPNDIPLFLLRVPLRYYRFPPPYFRNWPSHEAPRWGDRWGRDWVRRHRDWQKWERRTAPSPAPLPTYQRDFERNRYPRLEERRELRKKFYRYSPKDNNVRDRVQPRLDRRDSVPGRDRLEERPSRRGPENLQKPSNGRFDHGETKQPRFERRPQRGEDKEQRPPRLRGEGRRSKEHGPSRETRRDDRERDRDRDRGHD